MWQADLKAKCFGLLLSRPNPILAGEMLFATTQYPAKLVALAAKSGAAEWEARFHGNDADVAIFGGSVFAASIDSLSARIPATGQVTWERQIAGSGPVFVASSEAGVFVTCRDGLSCFSSASGTEMWSWRSAANVKLSPPLLGFDGLIVIATVGSGCVAIDATSGHEIWRRDLGPSAFGPIRFGGGVVLQTTTSVFLLSPETGETLATREWEGTLPLQSQGRVSGERFVLPIRNTLTWLDGALRDDLTLPLPRCSQDRIQSAGGRLYLSTFWGIRSIELGDHAPLITEIRSDRFRGSRVEAAEGLIYCMDREGVVCCLRYP